MEKIKDIKLLMIVGQFHPFVGGAEKECQKLSKKLIKEDISVTVLTQKHDGLPEYEMIDGIPVYRKIKGWHLFEISYMASVLYFLFKNRKKYNVIQCFGIYLFIPPVIAAKYLLRKKVVARVEGAALYGDFQRINKLKYGNLVLHSAKKVDRIIAISRDIYHEIIEHNFSKHTIVNIPNSVDVTIFQPGKKHGNRKIERIFFVGRLEAEKGLEYLIKAMKIVKDKWEEAKLLIVGEGTQRNTLEDLCKKLKLEDHVVFVGSTNDVLACYQDADIFVLPSIAEGMSLSLIEAMSCGLPVVATSVGGNPEVLDVSSEGKIISEYYIGKQGILVTPKDVDGLSKALLKLLQDEKLSSMLGTHARKYVEDRFCLDKVAGEYVDLYRSLL
jgi:glycosyltransferase involved in cell wall biosynthesis